METHALIHLRGGKSDSYYMFINPRFLREVYLETSASICLFSLSEEPRDCYIGTVTAAYSTKCCYECYNMEVLYFLLSI